jgi:serine/threonine-protein kinase RsbW
VRKAALSVEVDQVQIKLALFLPSEAASVPISRQVLDGCLQTLGVTPETRTDIALALTEACANVILHAGPRDEYEVTAKAEDGQCVIEVVNTGDGTATAVPADGMPPLNAEHGRGLKIMDAVVDNVRLTGGEHNETTVHFEKALQWLPGAAGKHLSADDG